MTTETEERRSHFWIPDEEVERLDKRLTGRSKQRDVVPAEHGAKLSASLQHVLEYSASLPRKGTLSDELVVFKVSLPDGEKLNQKKQLEQSGLTVHAVRDSRSAIVSSPRTTLQNLQQRLEAYRTSGRYMDYQYIDDFSPFTNIEKQTSEVRRLSASPGPSVDVQCLLLPCLSPGQYKKALDGLDRLVTEHEGKVMASYTLSDGTPVLRAVVETSQLSDLSSDDSVYRVEETQFFSTLAGQQSMSEINTAGLRVDDTVDVESLPVVVIMDTGVSFPQPFDSLVISHWASQNLRQHDDAHGTMVASRVVFGDNMGYQIQSGVLTPRARVLDAKIMDGLVPINVLIQRVQAAVRGLSAISRIFNLSVNVRNAPIEGDEMSILGFELDNLTRVHGVEFVISSGNHYLWQTAATLEEVISDDDSRISSPADSMLGISVGAVVSTSHARSISQENNVAPYSRIGPGFAGYQKPDLVAYSGNVFVDGGINRFPFDLTSLAMTPDGRVVPMGGTSFSAPVVAGDLAQIMGVLKGHRCLTSKDPVTSCGHSPLG